MTKPAGRYPAGATVAEYTTDQEDVTRKDGKVVDTIPTYIWMQLVGGDLDGQEPVGKDLEKKVIKYSEERGLVYSRRVHTFGAMRVIAYVSVDHPRSHFWPYEVMRAMAKSHHQMMKTDYQNSRGISRDGEKKGQ